MSLEESNKMSSQTPLQGSPSDPEWKLEDLQKAIIVPLGSAQYIKKILGGVFFIYFYQKITKNYFFWD